MFQRQTRLEVPHSKRSRLTRRATAAAAGLLLAFAMQAHALVMPGDHFIFHWIATAGPDTGVSGSVDLTVGAAQANPLFGITSFDVTVGGFCGICSPLTEDLSGAHVDAATLGLLGDVTGSFLGQAGGLHTFDLALTDIVNGTGTFTFTNTRVGDGSVVDSGTYAPLVAAVDEPSELLLFALGLVALAASRRRKR